MLSSFLNGPTKRLALTGACRSTKMAIDYTGAQTSASAPQASNQQTIGLGRFGKRRARRKSVQNWLVMSGELQAHKQPAFGAAVVLAERWLPSKTRFEAASFFGICLYAGLPEVCRHSYATSPLGAAGKKEGSLTRCWLLFAISRFRRRSILIW